MILLLAIAAIAAPAPSRAKATVRILRSASVTPVDRENAPAHQKREIFIRDQKGRPLRIRVIEYE